jgi:Rod binding domain-containing protein
MDLRPASPGSSTDRPGAASASRPAAGASPQKSEAKLEQTAREFERLLVEQMLTAMQESLEEGMFPTSGASSDWYTSLFNQEMSRQITADGGLGVARGMLEQLRAQDGAEQAQGSAGTGLLDLSRGAGMQAGLASLDRAFELRRRERESELLEPLSTLSKRSELYRAARAESTAADPPRRAEMKALVREVAAEVGVDARLALALVETESGFNPRARSPKGAMGLAQLMPDTARGLGVTDPLDPRQNLKGGLTYLKRMLEKYQDRDLALAAYNAGPGAVDRHKGIPPYRETRAYVARIGNLLREEP